MKSSARILTGWTVDMWETFARVRQEAARTGPSRYGLQASERDADGHAVTQEYLTTWPTTRPPPGAWRASSR